MKSRSLLCAALLALSACAVAQADEAARPAAAAKPTTKPAMHSAVAKPAMDPKAMEAMMEKMAAPGPMHERFRKMEGNWDAAVKWTMGPSQPMQESKSSAVIKTLMGGRYMEEDDTGEMMGKPFSGMSITGYDNVLKKYVGSWIDNAGTGIMTTTGVLNKAGNAINWTGQSSDPTTGRMARYRMVTSWPDDDHMTYEMFSAGPGGKEMKIMEINYTRKQM